MSEAFPDQFFHVRLIDVTDDHKQHSRFHDLIVVIGFQRFGIDRRYRRFRTGDRNCVWMSGEGDAVRQKFSERVRIVTSLAHA